MKNNDKINADRFLGFADTYDNARPILPQKAVDIITNYLNKKPDCVVDLGCGTGLSTGAWQGRCEKVIGIEPSDDMLKIAKKKQTDTVKFIKAFSDSIPIDDGCADVAVCSQSFHWMEPYSTLGEVNRILKNGGIFATVDCDWPPVCNWKAELAYTNLFNKVRVIESRDADINQTFNRFEKKNHLAKIKSSGYFKYEREIVFENSELCDAKRFIAIAMSQGSLQTILKIKPELILDDVNNFENKINKIFGDDEFEIMFCYRMRIGIK